MLELSILGGGYVLEITAPTYPCQQIDVGLNEMIPSAFSEAKVRYSAAGVTPSSPASAARVLVIA